jgi:predicted Zn finger-like uncharacterized protein
MAAEKPEVSMRLDCPSCNASFEVNPAALEPSGRTVRCAACKTTWFAVAPSFAMASAEADAPPPMPVPEVTADDRADHEALSAEAPIVVAESPPIAMEEPEAPPPMPKRKTVSRATSPARSRRRSPIGLIAATLAVMLVFGVVNRQAIVRAAPETASLYSAIGFPVNLRGLEFQNVQTRQEIQDGVTVLVIEGEVENVVNRAVELPRVRLSVVGDNGTEIYSWTALLPRSILYPRERVPFRSRLASPPAAGKEIVVRFLTRGDLTAAIR